MVISIDNIGYPKQVLLFPRPMNVLWSDLNARRACVRSQVLKIEIIFFKTSHKSTGTVSERQEDISWFEVYWVNTNIPEYELKKLSKSWLATYYI